MSQTIHQALQKIADQTENEFQRLIQKKEKASYARRQAERERDEAREIARKLERERDEAREIAAVYREYAQLLGDEINDMAGFASVHGWQSSRIEQGKLLRDKIKQLEAAK